MNKPVKTKLCWNCEGSVSRIAENCPYCGVYLSPENSAAQEEQEESVEPPVSKNSIPKAPYIPRSEKEEPLEQSQNRYSIEDTVQPVQFSLFRSVYLPVLLLSTGAISLLFSLILLAFATDGKLTLQWEQDLWPMFAVLALPLLFFGWRNIASDE